MKNTMRCLATQSRWLCAIALAAVIGFSFAACDIFDDDGGGGGYSGLAAPTGLTATAYSSSIINLSWYSVSGSTGYRIYQCTTSYGTYNLLGSTQNTSAINNELPANMTIYYKVTAYNSYGESGYSNLAYATTLSNGNGGDDGGTYSLGDTGPGGGKIFYYSVAGFTMTDNNQICHYLEAAPNDLGTLAWASANFTNVDILDTQTIIGNGRRNTARILATDPNAPAARACDNYSNNGQSDWFLPSTSEIQQLLQYRSGLVGNLLGTPYWTSNQNSRGNARAWTLGATSYSSPAKSTLYNVRPIRAF